MKRLIMAALVGMLAVACNSMTEMSDKKPMAMMAAPFGGQQDITYAASLWQALVAANLAGPDAVESAPYTGQHPHGAILQNIEGTVTIGPDTGVVIVKRNYGGEGVSIESVASDSAKYLKAVTVMFKREGYDPDNQDWFWVKYKPDGSLHTNPKGMSLAGRVAKMNPPKGCIACHAAAPGGDYVFTHDRLAQ